MVKKNEQLLIIYLTLFFLITIICISLFVKKNKQKQNIESKNNIPTSVQEERFISNTNKISIIRISPYFYQELDGGIIIKKEQGEILIGKSNLDFPFLDDYLKDLDKKYKIKDKNIFKVNNLNAVKVVFANPNRQGYLETTFYIVKDNILFSIEGSNEQVYEDMEKIVHSFKYLPEPSPTIK